MSSTRRRIGAYDTKEAAGAVRIDQPLEEWAGWTDDD